MVNADNTNLLEPSGCSWGGFSPHPVMVRFGAKVTTACVRIAIFNYSFDENSEDLQVVVLRKSGVQGLEVEEETGSLPVTIQGGTGVRLCAMEVAPFG